MIKNEVVNELMEVLGMEVSDIKSVDNDDDMIIFEDGSEYLVINELEKWSCVKDVIDNIVFECGINAFSENFQEYIKDNLLDENYFNELLNNDYSELLDVYGDDIDFVYYLNVMGELDEIINDNFYDIVDIEKLIDECIKWDGYGHFISTYDGKEIELSNDMYAYRIN